MSDNIDSDKAIIDYFDMEVNASSDFFMEQTRYTTLQKLLETSLVQYHTNLSNEEVGAMMYIKTWSRCWIEFMRPIDTYRNLVSGMKMPEAYNTPSTKTLRTINSHTEQILDQMKLSVSKKGWRANGLLDVLKADEKAAKRSIFGSMFRRSDDGASVSERS